MSTPLGFDRHGRDQAENTEERCTTDTYHERGPDQWTDVVQHVRSQTDDPANDAAEHRPDCSTRPLDRLVGHGSGDDLARVEGRVQTGESACDSHSLRLRSYTEGTMEKQWRLDQECAAREDRGLGEGVPAHPNPGLNSESSTLGQ